MAVKRYDGSQWVTVAGKGDQGTSSSIATWVKTASGGETSVSGNDDNSQPLSYTVGQELVFINGALQKRGSDYTATTGNSITGLTALAANDVVTVWTVNAFSVTDAIANSLVDAKGDLIVATGADTPGRLAVGTNGQVLTAASTTGTGLQWAAAPGSWTELASGSLTGSSVSITSISGDYRQLALICRDYYPATDDTFAVRVNSTSSIYATSYSRDSGAVSDTKLAFFLAENMDAADNNNFGIMFFDDYANTATHKITRSVAFQRKADNTNYLYGWTSGFIRTTSAITSIQIEYSGGANHSGGTYVLYGVK